MTATHISSLVDDAVARGFHISVPDGKYSKNINTHLLYQAGLDPEASPILVFSECYLPEPEPEPKCYDEMLTMFKQKLDSFVENDYVLVYFASSDVQKPSLPWIVNAYHDLDRKYKKNLKKLYLVHPSNWTKVLLNMFASILSPKFYSKLVYVESLEVLKTFISTTAMSIPETVVTHDSSIEYPETAPMVKISSLQTITGDQNCIFGTDITNVIYKAPSTNIYKLPLPVVTWLLTLHKVGTFTKDIFRRTPQKFPQLAYKSRILESTDVSQIVPEAEKNNPHVAAALLKIFFLELKPAPFTNDMIDTVLKMPVVKSKEQLEDITVSISSVQRKINFIKENILPSLSPEYRQLLLYLFSLLNNIAQNSPDTNMKAFNLAEVWAPILFRSNPDLDNVDWLYLTTVSPAMPSFGTVIHVMIQYFYSIFSDDINQVLGLDFVHSETLMDQLILSLEMQLNMYRA